MASVVPFSNRKRMAAQASEWLSRIDRGLKGTERAQLEEWLALDRRHPETLLEVAALWDQMEVLRELSDLFPLPTARSSRNHGKRLWGRGAAVLAALALVAICVQLLLPLADQEPPAGEPETLAARANSILSTAVGDQQVEILPDGSVVQLNTDSRIEVLYSASERLVSIHRGEVHFEVRHESARPFVVQAAGRRIQAVGTAFNVYVRDDARLEVLVTEGRVQISQSMASEARDNATSNAVLEVLRLTASELATIELSGHIITPVNVEERSSRLAWQRGMLIFNGESLESALQEVARYTDFRFEILDKELHAVRIGGVYKAGDVPGLIRSLEENFPLRIKHIEAEQIVKLMRREE